MESVCTAAPRRANESKIFEFAHICNATSPFFYIFID